jgi:hypothetical protein
MVLHFSWGNTSATELASGTIQYAPPLEQITFSIPSAKGDTPVQILIIGSIVYITMPASALTRSGVNTKWIKTSRTSLATGVFDITQFLQLLTSTSRSMKLVGANQIDGITTNHYHGTIELTRLRPVLKNLPQYLKLAAVPGVGTPLPLDVWLDHSGRPRHVLIYKSFARAPRGGTADASVFPVTVFITIDFVRYGIAVHVTAPPSSQVTTLTPEQLHPLQLPMGG